MFTQVWKKGHKVSILIKLIWFCSITVFIALFTPVRGMEVADSSLPPVFVLTRGDQTIYLLGTDHNAPLSWIPEQVISLFQTINTLFLEHELINISLYIRHMPSDEEVKKYFYLREVCQNTGKLPNIAELPQNIIHECAMLQFIIGRNENNKALINILNKQEYAKKKGVILRTLSFLNKHGGHIFHTDKDKIVFDFNEILAHELWLADLFLQSHVNLQIMNLTQNGMEKELRSHFQGKEIAYLETNKEIFTIMSKYQQSEKDYIDQIINNLQAAKTLLSLKPNTQSLITFLAPYLRENDYNIKYLMLNKVHQQSVAERNISWIKKIEHYLDNKPTVTILIAVGHGHLNGGYGLLSLFSKQGFEIFVLSQSGKGIEIPKIMLAELTTTKDSS